MFTKRGGLFRIFFTIFLLLGFVFLFGEKTFAVCDGTGSNWTVPPKTEPYEPKSTLETEAVLTNVSEADGFGKFILFFNGWRKEQAIAEGTYELGTPGDGGLGGSTLTLTATTDESGKPAWKARTVIPLTASFAYGNNIRYDWTDSSGTLSESCSLGAAFYFSQADTCTSGDGSSSSEWIQTTGKTPYSPGSIAVTKIKVTDWQGITDDISFFFDGWEFEYGQENKGWDPRAELTVTGTSGDTERVITMKMPIAATHADGWHRISYSWAIKDSYRRCSTRNMIMVKNPSVKGGTTVPTGRAMPKTGLLDDVNKIIVLGVGLVILGLTWTLVFPLIRKTKQMYFVTSTEISKGVKVAKEKSAKRRMFNRRDRFEKKI